MAVYVCHIIVIVLSLPLSPSLSLSPLPLPLSMYSIYNTVFTRGPAGLPVCVVNQPTGDQSQFRVIESIGRNDQVKFLFSPGIELDPDSVP